MRGKNKLHHNRSPMQSKKRLPARLILVLMLICTSCARGAAQETTTTSTSKPAPITYLAPTKANYLKLADEMETTLRRDVLGVWFPRTIDNLNGGFYSNFSRDWQRTRSEGKFSVFQGRITWLADRKLSFAPGALPVAKESFRSSRDATRGWKTENF